MPPGPRPPTDVPPLFEAERVRLLGLLSELSEADWRLPTPCPGWTVLGLACHLLGDDFGLLARRRDAHLGTPPPEGTDEAAFIEWLDDLQMAWVIAARRLSPRLVVELLRWTSPQLIETFRREDAGARSARVSWAGPEPVPVWLDQLRELSEYWIHRQQLLDALGRQSDLDPGVLGPILHGLRWAYPYRLRQAPATDGHTVDIRITGPVTERWLVVAEGGAWDFRDTPGTRIVATITMSTNDAWRLLTNNLSPEALSGIKIDGDPLIAEVLRTARAIIGQPHYRGP